MRLLRKHSGMAEHFDDIHPGCLSSEDARYMWGYYDTPTFVPLYGPQEVYGTIGDDIWNETISSLVASFKELCLYEIGNAATHEIVAPQVDECENALQQLTRHFYFKDSKLVCEFLNRHHSLIPVLLEVRKRIEQFFGTETMSNLELFTDPEDNHSTPKLFALILTTLPSSDASARLDLMDQEWWLNQPREVKRVLNIDVDYLDGSV